MTLIDRRKLFLKMAFIILMLSVAGIYGYFKAQNFLSGPKITVISPDNGSALSTTTTIIRGETKNISSLSLDDRTIFIDETGGFYEVMALSPGYNIISLKGADRFGKKTETVLELTVKK